MWMSKLVLDPRRAVGKNLYDTHRLLWNLFADAPDRTRDFLFREQDEPYTFLTVSRRQPEDTTGWWSIQIKPYAPKLQAGDAVAFSLRVNAVVKRNENGKQRRFDIVQDACLRMKELNQNAQMPTRAEIAQEAGTRWLLARQQALGLSIEPAAILVEGCKVERFVKRATRDTRSGVISLGIMDLQGTAEVKDPQLLLQALFQGVGPAKGFGCGLLLIRRV
jgi:CRISPR system Cascade subunit CasE